MKYTVLYEPTATGFSAHVPDLPGCVGAAPLKLVFLKSGGITTSMRFTIEIPDAAIAALKMPASEIQAELKKEVAVALYSRGALSLGKAVEIADICRADFENILGQHRIERPYSEEDLAEDLKFAREFPKTQ